MGSTKEISYKKALKRIVFLENIFSINKLPAGYTVKDYKEELIELQRIIDYHEGT